MISKQRSVFGVALTCLLLVVENATCVESSDRVVVMISDTHFGLGRNADGTWVATEDFRWNNALSGFLEHISNTYDAGADLIVLGDFLELWQPPLRFVCAHPTNDLGCTVEELAELTDIIVNAHEEDFQSLRKFVASGKNSIVVVPGNHDSALLAPIVWKVVHDAFGESGERVSLAEKGIWSSADGFLVAEHGHQIGADVNRLGNWPHVITSSNGIDYVDRSWGEEFVQTLFNSSELEYEAIDNISPESAGVRYRMADRGLKLSIVDVAKFTVFSAFQTSVKQKSMQMGAELSSEEGADVVFNARFARNLGYSLVMAAINSNDVLRSRIEPDGSIDQTMVEAMNFLVANRLSDSEVRRLCERASFREEMNFCTPPVMGVVVESILKTESEVLGAHLEHVRGDFPEMRYFVFGHTHKLLQPFPFRMRDHRKLMIANTGAFHRVIEESALERLMRKREISPDEALKKLGHTDLPACYTYAIYDPRVDSKLSLHRWHQSETAEAGESTFDLSPICQ